MKLKGGWVGLASLGWKDITNHPLIWILWIQLKGQWSCATNPPTSISKIKIELAGLFASQKELTKKYIITVIWDWAAKIKKKREIHWTFLICLCGIISQPLQPTLLSSTAQQLSLLWLWLEKPTKELSLLLVCLRVGAVGELNEVGVKGAESCARQLAHERDEHSPR